MSFELAVVVAGAFLAALAAGLAGFADALIMAALWLHVLAPVEAVPLILACGIVIHSVSVVHLRAHLNLARLWPFLAGGFLGVPAGTSLLTVLEPEPYRRVIGVVLVAYTLYALARHRPGRFAGAGAAADGAAGLVGGVCGGFAGLSGIAPTLWAGLRGWSKDVQRAIYDPFILLMQALALGWLAAAGAIQPGLGQRLALCLPAIVLGTWLGLRWYRRVDERLFRRLVLVMLLLSGVSLLV